MARTNRLRHLIVIDAAHANARLDAAGFKKFETIGLRATISLNAEGKRVEVISLEKQD